MFLNGFEKMFIVLALLKEGRVLTVATKRDYLSKSKDFVYEKNIMKFLNFVFSMFYHTVINHHRLNGIINCQQSENKRDNDNM
jgi:hypothetical protein